MKKILVTGGAGYLGSKLSGSLLEEGYEVVVFDNFMYGKKSLEHLLGNPQLTLYEGDIRDLRSIVKAFEKCDAVIHLASIVGDQAGGLEPKTTVEINLIATRMIAALCKLYGKQMIYASTCSVYGENGDKVFCETDPVDQTTPVSLYGQTKLLSEIAIQEEGSKATIMRMGTLFGLSNRMRFDLVINLFVAKSFFKEDITVFGGNQFRPFLHIQDAVQAYLLAVRDNWNGVYNVASKNYSLHSMANEIVSLYGGKMSLDSKTVDHRSYQACTHKITELGFSPRYDLRKGTLEIWNAFQQGQLSTYTNPIYSNFKLLFQSPELQRKLFTLGPVA